MALVIFDLDNTLIDRVAPFRRWADRFVARHGLDPAEAAWLEHADGDGFVPREVFLSSVLDRYGLAGSLDTFATEYRAEIVEFVDLDPVVPATLDRLRANGWRVAIATNGQTAQQSAKLRRTGLDRHVDAVAISEEVGAKKPDLRMFEAAADRCGERLDGTGWMVGDCATRDIGGGRQAGLRTAWLHRGRTWDPTAPAPDHIAGDIPGAAAAFGQAG